MPKSQAYILSIGNEVAAGKITDTNTAYLAAALRREGIELCGAAIVRDRIDEIASELHRAAGRAELVITTGGLGPTSDDLTREAIAGVAQLPLEENPAARKKLEALFEARKRKMNPTNLRQVQFPRGAEILNNRTGTADAFVTPVPAGGGKKIPVVSLPGVPAELKIIFEESLRPWLRTNFSAGDNAPAELVLRCFGCSESSLGHQIEGCALPPEIEVAYQPVFPEILLTFLHLGEQPFEERVRAVRALEPQLRQAIGEPFVIGNEKAATLPVVLGKLLAERELTLAAGESCSGGLIADLLVSCAGSSKYFSSSAVCYSNEAKSVYLGVRPALIARYGAVSAEIAVEMARGAKFRSGADIGVSITGIAGPEGGTPEKPVGTFFIGLATNDFEDAWPHFFPHERNTFRRFGAYLALDIVRRKVLGLPLSWERK